MTLVKKLLAVLTITLALNFVALAAAAAMIAQKAQLDRDKISQIKDVMFPAEEAAEDDTTDAAPPEPTPMEQLLAILDAEAGRGTEERIDTVSRTVDERLVLTSRTKRELQDRLRQLDAASRRLTKDREQFEQQSSAWTEQVELAAARAADEGYRKSLELYEQLQARQVKDLFLGLTDDVILSYLRDMDPAVAGKIVKEFKSDEEQSRIRAILEQLRAGDPELAAAGATPEAVN